MSVNYKYERETRLSLWTINEKYMLEKTIVSVWVFTAFFLYCLPRGIVPAMLFLGFIVKAGLWVRELMEVSTDRLDWFSLEWAKRSLKRGENTKVGEMRKRRVSLGWVEESFAVLNYSQLLYYDKWGLDAIDGYRENLKLIGILKYNCYGLDVPSKSYVET